MNKSFFIMLSFIVFQGSVNAMEQKHKLNIVRLQRGAEIAPQQGVPVQQAIVVQPPTMPATKAATSKLSIKRPIKGPESAPQQTVAKQSVAATGTMALVSANRTTHNKVTIKSSPIRPKPSIQATKIWPRLSKLTLNEAARKGDLDEVRFLLNCGADINQQNSGVQPHFCAENMAPLHEAAARGYIDVVELLLDAVADTNLRDSRGRTPLYYAIESCNQSQAMVELIIGHLATVNLQDRMGYTPLHSASSYGSLEVLKLY